ncbi:MAG: RagB/SusD family nutrient uptake outer membrane protein [Bacteroidales bacterium]|nr:RagB/SusD family nutrient uptake outer membrane protein [Bacteroidales bacterium]
MKKLIYIIVAGALFFTSSCEDFLDTQNLYQKSLENFYRTPQDIQEAMGGVYNALYVAGPHSEEHLTANLLADYMFGGGGPDDISAKNVASFVDPAEDTYRDLWRETYNGVYRANAIIEAVAENDYSGFFNTEDQANNFKNTALGEAYFMRGFFMFRAARFFGGMPLIPTTDAPRDVPRSSFAETFGQIAADFKMAAETMPAVAANTIPVSEFGHANRWVAKAYLARTYLFYTGYMTNIEKTATDVVPLPDGGSLTKAEVIQHLEDVRNQSGHALVTDFRNLWPYSYVNTSAGTTVLPWAETEGLAWVGQDGHNSTIGTGNPEVMFSLRYAFGNWGWDGGTGQKYNNRVCLFFGIRGNSMVPFGQGWGWGTIHPALFNDWPNDDPRKEGSILVMGDAAQATDGYEANKGDHETGYFNKKYTTLQHDGDEGVKGMFYYLYGWSHGDPFQLWAAQDYYYLRFSDILLMHSELTETATGMNLVRERAGLDPVAYSLDNLKRERLYEFAFEGIRWFDLVRWGDVENSANNYYSRTAEVNNSGVAAVHSVNYRPETKGLLPIPESEIRLSNGVYTQNPGW